MEDLQRILDLTCKELEADDARLELGGREPGDDAVWCRLPDGMHRIVVIFDGELPASVEALRDRLKLVVGGFSSSFGSVRPPRPPSNPRRSLDDALDVLANQTGAREVLVVDETSPMVWGSSLGEEWPENVHDAARAVEAAELARNAGIDLAAHLAGEASEKLPDELARLIPELLASAEGVTRDTQAWNQLLQTFACVTALRDKADGTGISRWAEHEPGRSFLARGFGGIYWLVLVFDDPSFSELHVEAATIHAAPWIERLVTSLPPVDPDGGPGARVVKLRRLRPV